MEERKLKRVTRADIRSIKPGQSVIFRLPNMRAVETAQAQTYLLKRLESTHYTTSVNPDERSVTITRH